MNFVLKTLVCFVLESHFLSFFSSTCSFKTTVKTFSTNIKTLTLLLSSSQGKKGRRKGEREEGREGRKEEGKEGGRKEGRKERREEGRFDTPVLDSQVDFVQL